MAVGCEFEETPGGRLGEQFGLEIPAEGEGDVFDGVLAPPELLDERRDMQLGAALDERHLSVGDDDAPDFSARWQIGS